MENDEIVEESLKVKEDCYSIHRLSIIDTADKTNSGLSINEKFKIYLISYERNSSKDDSPNKFLTWRRYSEFDRLYSYLRHIYKNFEIPILPQKSKILKEKSSDIFDREVDFLFGRKFLLNEFLQKLTWNKEIIDNEIVQRFLTSKDEFHHDFEKLKIIVNLKSITFSSFNSNGEKESSLIIDYLLKFSKNMKNLRKFSKNYRYQQYTTFQYLIPFECVLSEIGISEEKCLSIIPNGIRVEIEEENERKFSQIQIMNDNGNDIFEEEKEKNEKRNLSSQNLNVDLFTEIGHLCDIFTIIDERKFLEVSQEEFLIYQQLKDLSEEAKNQRHEEFTLIDEYCSELERIDSKERHLTRYQHGRFSLSFHDLKNQIFKESTEEKRRRQQQMKEEIDKLRECLNRKKKILQCCILEGRKELVNRFKIERKNILRNEMKKLCQYQIQNCKTMINSWSNIKRQLNVQS
ncbi:hypothetical protein SNEBB_006333 [Seison nebaliae]|nr:hypothetical protein SNEBB_006333 [Seison nebaliae]